MENLTPSASQENTVPESIESTHGEEPLSSPIASVPGSQQGSKPRKPPTITPRSFTRFFTPKSSIKRGGRIGASRQVLRDITATASNRRRSGAPRHSAIKILDEGSPERTDNVRRRKRKIPDRVNVTPDRSSPVKRIRNQSLGLSESSDGESRCFEEGEEQTPQKQSLPWNEVRQVETFRASNYRRKLGRDLQREIGTNDRVSRARALDHRVGSRSPKDWQCETANFSSRPEDIHVCNNVEVATEHSIPFCAASCNSEFLVLLRSVRWLTNLHQRIPL